MQVTFNQYCEKPLKMWDGFTTELKRIRSLEGFDKVGAFAMPFFALGILIHGDRAPVAFQKMTDVYEEYRNFYDGTGWVNVVHNFRNKAVTWEIVAASKRILFDAVTVMTANEMAALFGLPSFSKVITLATPFRDISFSIGKVAVEALPLKVICVIIAISEDIFEHYKLSYKIHEKREKLQEKIQCLDGKNLTKEKLDTFREKNNKIFNEIKALNICGESVFSAQIKEINDSIVSAPLQNIEAEDIKAEDLQSRYIKLVTERDIFKFLKRVKENPNSNEAAKDLLSLTGLVRMGQDCYKENKREQYAQKAEKYRFDRDKNWLNLATSIPKVLFLSMVAGKAQFGIEAMKWAFRSEIIGTALGVNAQTVYEVGFQSIKFISGTFGVINFLRYAEEPKVMCPADFRLKNVISSEDEIALA